MGRKRTLGKEEVINVINKLIVTNGGASPTIEELRKALPVGSTRTVLRYLQWLEDEGDIERWPGARGFRLVKTSKAGLETREIPLVGTAPAGPFMLAEENIEGMVRLPKELLQPPSAKYFLLRVRGNSMNRGRVGRALIEDGDLVLVRQQFTAEPKEVVVALIDGEATIKRFDHGKGYYVLKPESTNPEHKPIIATRDFRILGVVSFVLKKGAKLLNIGT
jgi:repressor LexA